MEIELKYRKELLIRKNKCKEYYGQYLRKIADLFPIDITKFKFLSLEESEYIRKKKIERKIHTKRYNASSKSDLNDLIQKLKGCKGIYYIFIDHDWEYCGCFQIENLEMINENFKFGNYITDNLVFIEDTTLSKIILDYYEMDNQFFIDYEEYAVK
jgi:hypothetical protein